MQRHGTRLGLAGLALLILPGVTAGCAPTHQAVQARSTASASTGPRGRAEACADAVRYWVGKRLASLNDDGFDYQEMGLSDSQYDIYLRVLPSPPATGVPSMTLPAPVATQIVMLCSARETDTADNGHGWPAG